jgi:hypothetical protein
MDYKLIIDKYEEIAKNLRTLIRHCDCPEADNPRFDMVLELTKKDKVLTDQLKFTIWRLEKGIELSEFSQKYYIDRDGGVFELTPEELFNYWNDNINK